MSELTALAPFADLEDDLEVTRSGPDGERVLLGASCNACSETWFPQRPVCPRCASDDLAEYPIGPDGTLYTFSAVHVSSARETPYVLGYVDTTQGVRVLAEIRTDGALAVDTPYTLVLGDGSSWWFAPKEDAR